MDFKNSLGTSLRKLRESKKLSLRNVEDKLHIRRAYLEAIEKGEYEAIPSEIYVRGFLRSYARFLGVSSEKCLRRYEEEKEGLQKKACKKAEPSKRVEPRKTNEPSSLRRTSRRDLDRDEIAERTDQRRKKEGGSSGWVLGVLCFLLVVGIGLWQGPNVISLFQSQMKTGTGSVKVETLIERGVWLQVWVDGRLKGEGYFPSNSRHEWQGTSEVRITAGDGSRIFVKPNGLDQRKMSDFSEVTQLVFKAP